MISETFLRSLYGLSLATPKRHRGNLSGERRSTRRGRSVEFADYRNYTPGDDPRRVDWNIYARLDKPYIKLYEDEQDVSVHILLDASPSMLWRAETEEQSNKWRRVTELALALGYVALTSGDQLTLEFSTRERLGPKRGTAATAELMSFVERKANEYEGHDLSLHWPSVSLNAWWKRYALDARPGICIILSDLLDADGCNDGMNALGSSRLDVRLLHTLCPAELEPDLAGDIRLKDVETAAAQDVSLDEATLRQYRDRVGEWSAAIADSCHKRGGRYHLVNTATPIEQIVLRDLRRARWLV